MSMEKLIKLRDIIAEKGILTIDGKVQTAAPPKIKRN